MKLAVSIVRSAQVALALVLAVPGCAGDETERSHGQDGGATNCAAGERTIDGSGCLGPGIQDDGCPAGTLGLGEGACRAAGIPPDECAHGFQPNGNGGCDAILPAQCSKGLMAVPGETTCREVAPCATGTWGQIPVEPSTEYVDAAYVEGDSDGSASKPWTTIQAGVDAASPAAIVAVAAGSYVEDVVIAGKPVRLWGRCPKLVEIVGTGSDAAVLIRNGADRTEVRDLALRGAVLGLEVSGSHEVVANRVWLHDAMAGLQVLDTLGPTSLALTGALVEETHGLGIFVLGADVTVAETVVRDVQSQPGDQKFGYGIGAILSDKGRRARTWVRASVIEHNHNAGVLVGGSDATIESSVIRDTQGQQLDQRFGSGILATDEPASGQRANLWLRSSVVERNLWAGVFVQASDALVESTAIRDTQPQASDHSGGAGFYVQHDADNGQRGSAILRASIVERNRLTGVLIRGSDAAIEATIVRDTREQASDELFGRGIDVQDDPETGNRGFATVRGSIAERNRDVGLFVGGSDATIDGTVVRDTQPATDQRSGRGVQVGERANATIRATVVERNHEFGICIVASEATIHATVVRDTQSRASDDGFGDGLAADGAGRVDVSATLVGGSARAGVSSFASEVSLVETLFDCNVIHIDGENPYPDPNASLSFGDLAGNACGCGGEPATCQVISSGLAPPEPMSPVE